MDYQIVILAGGKGARMGIDVPKVLLPIKDKPVIGYLLEQVSKLGNNIKPIIVVGYKYTEVQKALGDSYVYAIQRQQLGSGHAVMAAEKYITADNFIVLYGDVPFVKASSIKKLLQLHQNQSAKISMFTTHLPSYQGGFGAFMNFGRIVRDGYDNITKIVEYKDASPAEREILEVNPGIYAFNTEWLTNHIHLITNNNAQEEYYLTDIVALAMQEEVPVYSLPINYKEIIGINTPEQLKVAEKFISGS